MDAVSARTPAALVRSALSEDCRGDVSIPLAMLRAALSTLGENPPFALGQSSLARRLLPDEWDVLQRGWALSEMLCHAIACLRPEPRIPAGDGRQWPYRICVGLYLEARSRGELEAELHISRSTYTRAKRRGLDVIAAVLPAVLAQSRASRAAKLRTTWRVLRGRRQAQKRRRRDG